MAVAGDRIVAVGNSLQHDPDFKSYSRIDLHKRTVVPGFIDAHTHFFFYAMSLSRVSLDGIGTLEGCLKKIKNAASKLKSGEWVTGEGYAPDRFTPRIEPDCTHLDKIIGDRPAFFYSKDQHSAWVNSRGMKLAGIDHRTKNPSGGLIERFKDGSPNGILRETACSLVLNIVPQPKQRQVDRCYRTALENAYRRGVTGVHSFDSSAEAFGQFVSLAECDKVGLRINYYFPASRLAELHKEKIHFGEGTDLFRVAGVKIFADGSLGSRTARCFNKYSGSRDNYGIEVTPVKQIQRQIRSAARLGLPCAIHAIGDRAVANVLEALETAPRLSYNARHRIEHLQLIRRKDIPRLKRLNITASMQPSHCPSDIQMIRKYWKGRSGNAFIFRTLTDKSIPLAFGSDVPIEPLDPIAGIAAAVRRVRPGSRDIFHPEQRITAAEALYNFTAGPAYAVGQEDCRGYLLEGYPADFVLLSDNICKVPPTRITDIEILATVIGGKIKYQNKNLNLF